MDYACRVCCGEHARKQRAKGAQGTGCEEEDLESIGDPTDPLEVQAAVDIPTQPDEYLVLLVLLHDVSQIAFFHFIE